MIAQILVLIFLECNRASNGGEEYSNTSLKRRRLSDSILLFDTDTFQKNINPFIDEISSLYELKELSGITNIECDLTSTVEDPSKLECANEINPLSLDCTINPKDMQDSIQSSFTPENYPIVQDITDTNNCQTITFCNSFEYPNGINNTATFTPENYPIVQDITDTNNFQTITFCNSFEYPNENNNTATQDVYGQQQNECFFQTSKLPNSDTINSISCSLRTSDTHEKYSTGVDDETQKFIDDFLGWFDSQNQKESENIEFGMNKINGTNDGSTKAAYEDLNEESGIGNIIVTQAICKNMPQHDFDPTSWTSFVNFNPQNECIIKAQTSSGNGTFFVSIYNNEIYIIVNNHGGTEHSFSSFIRKYVLSENFDNEQANTGCFYRTKAIGEPKPLHERCLSFHGHRDGKLIFLLDNGGRDTVLRVLDSEYEHLHSIKKVGLHSMLKNNMKQLEDNQKPAHSMRVDNTNQTENGFGHNDPSISDMCVYEDTIFLLDYVNSLIIKLSTSLGFEGVIKISVPVSLDENARLAVSKNIICCLTPQNGIFIFDNTGKHIGNIAKKGSASINKALIHKERWLVVRRKSSTKISVIDLNELKNPRNTKIVVLYETTRSENFARKAFFFMTTDRDYLYVIDRDAVKEENSFAFTIKRIDLDDNDNSFKDTPLKN